jgi:hypothetical protein
MTPEAGAAFAFFILLVAVVVLCGVILGGE